MTIATKLLEQYENDDITVTDVFLSCQKLAVSSKRYDDDEMTEYRFSDRSGLYVAADSVMLA